MLRRATLRQPMLRQATLRQAIPLRLLLAQPLSRRKARA